MLEQIKKALGFIFKDKTAIVKIYKLPRRPHTIIVLPEETTTEQVKLFSELIKKGKKCPIITNAPIRVVSSKNVKLGVKK